MVMILSQILLIYLKKSDGIHAFGNDVFANDDIDANGVNIIANGDDNIVGTAFVNADTHGDTRSPLHQLRLRSDLSDSNQMLQSRQQTHYDRLRSFIHKSFFLAMPLFMQFQHISFSSTSSSYFRLK